jgi:hypothetical protein
MTQREHTPKDGLEPLKRSETKVGVLKLARMYLSIAIRDLPSHRGVGPYGPEAKNIKTLAVSV